MSVATTSRVHDAIVDAVSTFRVPGVQVAWLSDGRIEQVAAGTLGPGRPVTAATRFPLASVTKLFTATLAMQLVADDELSLDRPIGRSLPAGEARDRLGEITLAQLLSHTGGLENDHADEGGYESTRACVRALARQRLLFPPGQQFSYANAGYVVAGHLIEAATGMSWADAVRSFLLEPLGASASFTQTETCSGDVVAAGHVRRRDGDMARVAAPPRGRGWAPAAGLAVSAADLLRLVQMHMEGGRTRDGYSLLPSSLVEEMRTRHVTVPNPGYADGWGLGFGLYRSRSGSDVWFGHDGDGRGTTAYVRACADQGVAVAMLTCCLPAREEWRRLLRMLAQAGVDVGDPALPPLPSRPQPIDPGVTGVYEYLAGRLTVSREYDELRLTTSAQDRLTLTPVGGDRCLAVRGGHGGGPFLVVFLRDDEGCVRYLHVGGRVARRVSG